MTWKIDLDRIRPGLATSGQVATYNATTRRYEPAASQGGAPTGRISGKSYPAGTGQAFGSNGTTTLDTLYAVPFFVGASCTFDRISVNANGTASSKMRVGLYDDAGGKPGALIVDGGQLDTSSSAIVSATISVTRSGLIWVAAAAQSVAGSVARMGAATANQFMGTVDHRSSIFNSVAYSQTGVSGALPSPWGSTYTDAGTTNTIPQLWLRVA